MNVVLTRHIKLLRKLHVVLFNTFSLDFIVVYPRCFEREIVMGVVNARVTVQRKGSNDRADKKSRRPRRN